MLERHTTTRDCEVTKGRQRSMKSHVSKIIKHEGTKTNDSSTTTYKVQDKEVRRPNHVEHHSNDHPLGGICKSVVLALNNSI